MVTIEDFINNSDHASQGDIPEETRERINDALESINSELYGPENIGSSQVDSRIEERTDNEFALRYSYSRQQLIVDRDTTPHESNDRLSDEAVVSKFGKSLPHDDDTGLPTAGAYDKLVTATETGGEEVAYGDIPQADPDGFDNVRPLVQPESAWTYQTEGASTAQLRIAVPPAFDDPETGAEMVELYWRALTRDVKFRNYGSDSLIGEAVTELDRLNGYNGPGADSGVTRDNVFRGVTPGATVGPYVSQFLWKDRELGGGVEDQKIEVQASGSDYATDVSKWKTIQKGLVPSENEFRDTPRYIITGRDMCERVHDDPPFRQLQKAAQVLIFTMNAPLDGGIPYTLKGRGNFRGQTTGPFNDFGPLYIEKKLLEVSEHGQKAAWHKKWNVHRRLRPEEYGGRIQAALSDELAEPDGVDLQSLIPNNLLDSDALKKTEDTFESYLLPQAYAEGSPTHPSYPAGHSVVAGAGVTLLKALFDGDHSFGDEAVIPDDDESKLESYNGDTLTVRGELNKLASNMALGRNRAGIHYRTDGIEGLRLGEAAAIRFLEDQLTLPTRVQGDLTLTFEKFDGEKITVRPTV